jgi:hypothetical protein
LLPACFTESPCWLDEDIQCAGKVSGGLYLFTGYARRDLPLVRRNLFRLSIYWKASGLGNPEASNAGRQL